MSDTGSFRIGIDLGGTKIEAVALAHDGARLWGQRVPTPQAGYDAVLDCIRTLVEQAERHVGMRGSVGVGTPGSLSPTTGLQRNANTTCLNGRRVDADLSQRLGREVRLANDANCFALSEAMDGAARDARVVFGVILGTGAGAGVVVDKRVLTGRNAIAGEWGHNPLPWPRPDELPGPPCFCGKHGCVETFVSGTGFARDYAQHAGTPLSAAEVAADAARGEPNACAALDRYLDRLARALALVINVLDPDVVVLGGGVSHVEALYTELPARLSAYVFSDNVTTPIVRAQHGDAGGVRGAAWLWPVDDAQAAHTLR
jgi:fructokinase